MSHMTAGVAQANTTATTWPHAIHVLLHRCLTDVMLQPAYCAVSRATQQSNEDEFPFSRRIQEVPRERCQIYTPVDMVSCSIREHHEAVRECVREDI